MTKPISPKLLAAIPKTRKEHLALLRRLENEHDDESLMRPFDFAHALKNTDRNRYKAGDFSQPGDVRALRRFLHMTQEKFAVALCLNLRTLQNWEQGRCPLPERALHFLSLVARHPSLARAHRLSYDARLIAHPDW